jgi:hypothetical protein
VVHRHRLTRREDAEVDPELRETRLALELADGWEARPVAPPRLARIQDEPALSL